MLLAVSNDAPHRQTQGGDRLIGYEGLTRLRTDGKVWVVDYMHENYTDRNTKNPDYQ